MTHTNPKTAHSLAGGAAAQKMDNGSMTEIELIIYAMIACFLFLLYYTEKDSG